MKLTAVVAKNLKKITVLNLLLTVVENIVFLAVGYWSVQVLAGSALGLAVSVLNFYLLGISVQKAMDKEPKAAQAYMQSTYNGRMLIETVALIAAFVLPYFNGFAAVFPLIFTRISIMIIQKFDKNNDNKEGR